MNILDDWLSHTHKLIANSPGKTPFVPRSNAARLLQNSEVVPLSLPEVCVDRNNYISLIWINEQLMRKIKVHVACDWMSIETRYGAFSERFKGRGPIDHDLFIEKINWLYPDRLKVAIECEGK